MLQTVSTSPTKIASFTGLSAARSVFCSATFFIFEHGKGVLLATFYGFCSVSSTKIAFAGYRDGKKPNYESRRHKGCFASKRRFQSVTNIASAKKGNHPEKEKALNLQEK